MQDESVTVGILLPVLNGMPWLEDTLASLFAQAETDWRCYAGDLGSQDRSPFLLAEYAARDPRIEAEQILYTGPVSVYQEGLRRIQSRYALALGVGDRLVPDALTSLVAALEANPAHVGAYGKLLVRDEQGRVRPQGLEKTVAETLRGMQGLGVVEWQGAASWECSLVKNPAPLPATLFKRSLALESEGFDPNLREHLDWDLWLKMSRHGTFAPLEAVVVETREREEDPDLVRIRRRQEAAYIRERVASRRDLTPRERRQAALCYEVGGLLWS